MKFRLCLWCSVSLGALAVWMGMRFWTTHKKESLMAQEYQPPPPGMVLVPAGEFWMGSNDLESDPDERPLRKVFLPAFYIDKLEMTNRRFQALKPDHRYPAGEDELPVSSVLKRDAEDFCRRAGRRLPTNAEWEKAARGTDGRTFPWGNEFQAGLANLNERSSRNETAVCKLPLGGHGSHGKMPGGSFPGGVSPYGCQDMAGNVWEWVSDVWIDKGLFGQPIAGTERGIIRGGAQSYAPFHARTSHQGFEDIETTCHDVGFRCALEAVVRKK